VALVLGDDADAPDARIHAVGQQSHDAEFAAKYTASLARLSVGFLGGCPAPASPAPRRAAADPGFERHQRVSWTVLVEKLARKLHQMDGKA
jgi:hypothetical protein